MPSALGVSRLASQGLRSERKMGCALCKCMRWLPSGAYPATWRGRGHTYKQQSMRRSACAVSVESGDKWRRNSCDAARVRCCCVAASCSPLSAGGGLGGGLGGLRTQGRAKSDLGLVEVRHRCVCDVGAHLMLLVRSGVESMLVGARQRAAILLLGTGPWKGQRSLPLRCRPSWPAGGKQGACAGWVRGRSAAGNVLVRCCEGWARTGPESCVVWAQQAHLAHDGCSLAGQQGEGHDCDGTRGVPSWVRGGLKSRGVDA